MRPRIRRQPAPPRSALPSLEGVRPRHGRPPLERRPTTEPDSSSPTPCAAQHRRTIRVLTPVTRDGGPDQTRPVVYTGEAQIMTNMGPIPISFEIPAATLGEAVHNYGDAEKEGVERTMR